VVVAIDVQLLVSLLDGPAIRWTRLSVANPPVAMQPVITDLAPQI
jgi:hypothetical protein